MHDTPSNHSTEPDAAPPETPEAAPLDLPPTTRRSFMARATGAAMGGGLVASYGTAAYMAGRFLYPARTTERRWLYVATAASIAEGDSIAFRTPLGERVAIARQTSGSGAEDFVALSSTCPHLGCQVHWEAPKARFFCPCHNGVFAPDGSAVSGPPAKDGTDLARFPLKVENGLLYIEVPVEGLGEGGDRA